MTTDLRDIRTRVLAAATAPRGSGDPDFDALAVGSLIAAFNRLAPTDMVLEPRTDLGAPSSRILVTIEFDLADDATIGQVVKSLQDFMAARPDVTERGIGMVAGQQRVDRALAAMYDDPEDS